VPLGCPPPPPPPPASIPGNAGKQPSLQPAARALLQRFSDRPALHALTLGFTHPSTGARLEWDSELPADMQSLLGDLRAFGQR